jgi:prepilin-type N-terminal cleavage/methylation domain-containing protein
MQRRQAGFTLTELIVVLFPVSLITAGVVGFFSSHQRTYVQQDLAVATEENVRAAMGMVTDTLRTAGCGVPKSNLGEWITWVSGFDNDPLLIAAGGESADTVSVAACAPEPVARLSSRADPGDTVLFLASNYAGISIADLLNSSDKSLIWLGDTEHAVVTSVAGGMIHIDTDPSTNGEQGVARAYLPGTPITRIDVSTFEVVPDDVTGIPWLRLNKHRGSQDPAAEGISDLKITATVPGRRYQVTLTARSETADPVSGQLLTRTLSSDVSLRN